MDRSQVRSSKSIENELVKYKLRCHSLSFASLSLVVIEIVKNDEQCQSNDH
jgi:hypothetical protein